MSNQNEMTLFAFGGLDVTVNKVFSTTDKFNANGGYMKHMKRNKRADVAKAAGLINNKENKRKIDKIIREGGDALKVKQGAIVAALTQSSEFTGRDIKFRRNKKGGIVVVLEWEHTPVAEKLMTVAEVAAMYGESEAATLDRIARQEAAQEAADAANAAEAAKEVKELADKVADENTPVADENTPAMANEPQAPVTDEQLGEALKAVAA